MEQRHELNKIVLMLINLATQVRGVQKLRNGQRGEGFDDFFTYRYVYLRGRGIL